MIKPFALFKLPNATTCTWIQQTNDTPLLLDSCHKLNEVKGYVFAPFNISENTPIVVIQPDEVKKFPLTELKNFIPLDEKRECLEATQDKEVQKKQYTSDFERFHKALKVSDFEKLVLARKETWKNKKEEDINIWNIFHEACLKYPTQYVALVSAAPCGTWLMATPEVLLQQRKDTWHTMSLAGTHQGMRNWEEKNITEQDYVTQYIYRCLKKWAVNIKIEEPHTIKAGQLTHLKTGFTFHLKTNDALGQLIGELYPTPAVCGLPKEQAKRFIIANEYAEREYYSGFAGMVDQEDDTQLFVTLRCMKIEDRMCHLYAGGGLLKASEMESEWQETMVKLQTMKECLVTNNI